MDNIYLLSYGEIGLKGKNQKLFIQRLKKNILNNFPENNLPKIQTTYGRLFLYSSLAHDDIKLILSKSFGLVGFTSVNTSSLCMDAIKDVVNKMVDNHLTNNKAVETFRISARRSNKNFPFNSSHINNEMGGLILKNFPGLKVRLKSPDLNINIEIREKAAYIYFKMEKAPGGLPVGSSGKGLLLLSGGIDSPVAGWMMLKRGMDILPLHFFSPPYTSPRAREKVLNLAKIIQKWGARNKILIVNFTKIQEKINKTRKKELTTVLVRKAMLKIAEILCEENKIHAIITGENLGQVASQTVHSMKATSMGTEYPIFRPLIGMDKIEIINLAKKIESYETSILPYEDCCTLFLPESPATKPNARILNYEFNALQLDELIKDAISTIDIKNN